MTKKSVEGRNENGSRKICKNSYGRKKGKGKDMEHKKTSIKKKGWEPQKNARTWD